MEFAGLDAVWRRHYPHPLAVQATTRGLRVFYPGAKITANKDGIFGFMPDKSGEDLVLGHSAVVEFPNALVDGFSDWFVAVRFASGQSSMRVSYGHGSPFVFASYEGGNPRLSFGQAPKVWSGDAKSAILGITSNGKHYGLFGPSGSTWKGIGEKTLEPVDEVLLLPGRAAGQRQKERWPCSGATPTHTSPTRRGLVV